MSDLKFFKDIFNLWFVFMTSNSICARVSFASLKICSILLLLPAPETPDFVSTIIFLLISLAKGDSPRRIDVA